MLWLKTAEIRITELVGNDVVVAALLWARPEQVGTALSSFSALQDTAKPSAPPLSVGTPHAVRRAAKALCHQPRPQLVSKRNSPACGASRIELRSVNARLIIAAPPQQRWSYAHGVL